MPRSLIEQWFPAAAVGAESLRDASAAKKPPVSRLHVWWARRPLTASRAAVTATLLPAWPSEAESAGDPRQRAVLDALHAEFPGGADEYHGWFLRTMGILGDPVAGRARIKVANARNEKLKDNGYGYARAFTVTPDDKNLERILRLTRIGGSIGDPPVVLDPFAGGGAIPFEASRFGFAAIANELNPVATAILHGTVELPATLGPDFVNVIDLYGKRWSDAVGKRLAHFFPKEADDGAIVGYIWAHTVPCPTTGRPTPLIPDFWLTRGGGEDDFAVELDPDAVTGTVDVRVVAGPAARRAGPRSTYKEGTATSIWSGHSFGGDYIREQALAGHVGAILLAVAYERHAVRGRRFRTPTTRDRDAAAAATVELEKRLAGWRVQGLVPDEDVFEGKETTRSVQMGLVRWSQMFSDRQLLVNLTALEELNPDSPTDRSEQHPISTDRCPFF